MSVVDILSTKIEGQKRVEGLKAILKRMEEPSVRTLCESVGHDELNPLLERLKLFLKM